LRLSHSASWTRIDCLNGSAEMKCSVMPGRQAWSSRLEHRRLTLASNALLHRVLPLRSVRCRQRVLFATAILTIGARERQMTGPQTIFLPKGSRQQLRRSPKCSGSKDSDLRHIGGFLSLRKCSPPATCNRALVTREGQSFFLSTRRPASRRGVRTEGHRETIPWQLRPSGRDSDAS